MADHIKGSLREGAPAERVEESACTIKCDDFKVARAPSAPRSLGTREREALLVRSLVTAAPIPEGGTGRDCIPATHHERGAREAPSPRGLRVAVEEFLCKQKLLPSPSGACGRKRPRLPSRGRHGRALTFHEGEGCGSRIAGRRRRILTFL